MIRKLADRLAKVDLLGEAALLLEHQLKFRLSGVQKARVATRLAVIRLLDRKPDRALDALRNGATRDLPVALATQRRHLEAQILGELKRPADAIAVLAADRSLRADELRVGIHLRDKNWDQVAACLRRLTSRRSITNDDEDGVRWVLLWAIALSMENDSDGLARLRTRFGTVMAGTRHAKAFRAIVGRDNEDVSDYRALAKQVGDLDTFKAFMTSYRERLKTSPLSTIN